MMVITSGGVVSAVSASKLQLIGKCIAGLVAYALAFQLLLPSFALAQLSDCAPTIPETFLVVGILFRASELRPILTAILGAMGFEPTTARRCLRTQREA